MPDGRVIEITLHASKVYNDLTFPDAVLRKLRGETS